MPESTIHRSRYLSFAHRDWRLLALTAVSAAFTFCVLTRIRTPLDLNFATICGLPLILWRRGHLRSSRSFGVITFATCALITTRVWLSTFGAVPWHQTVADTALLLGMRGLAIQIATRDLQFVTRLSLAVIATCVMSSVLLALTIVTPDAIAIRYLIYPFLDNLSDAPVGVDLTQSTYYQGGLSWTVVGMGYQLAMAMPLALCIAAATGRYVHLLAPIALVVGIVLCGQRSALGAALCGCLIMCISSARSALAFTRTALVGLVLLAGMVALVPQAQEALGLRSNNLVSKLERGAGEKDSRFAVQAWAVAEVPARPFGFLLTNDYDLRAPQTGDEVLAPHNHVLTFTVLYGWLVGSLAIAVLLSCAWRLPALIREGRRLAQHAVMLGWAAAFVAVTLNSLFHNAGNVSLDGPSLFATFVVLGLSPHTASRLRGSRGLR